MVLGLLNNQDEEENHFSKLRAIPQPVYLVTDESPSLPQRPHFPTPHTQACMEHSTPFTSLLALWVVASAALPFGRNMFKLLWVFRVSLAEFTQPPDFLFDCSVEWFGSHLFTCDICP